MDDLSKASRTTTQVQNDFLAANPQLAELVRRIAYDIHRKKADHASDDLAELTQIGFVGLFEAASRFDPSNGASLETFAGTRIRGAMLDHLRNTDTNTRKERRSLNNLHHAENALSQELLRKPTESEVAARMGIGLKDLHKIRTEEVKLASLDDPMFEGFDVEDVNGGDFLNETGLNARQIMEMAEDVLDDREIFVMSHYYGLKGDYPADQEEIAKALNVTESRISQIRKGAIKKIRQALSNDGVDLDLDDSSAQPVMA